MTFANTDLTLRTVFHKRGVEVTLDSDRVFQVVETFANLIYENERTNIMVKQYFSMCKYVDRVLNLQDSKLVKVITAGKGPINWLEGIKQKT